METVASLVATCPTRFWIRGWIDAASARSPRFWKAVGTRPPMWFVPVTALRPIDRWVELSADQVAEADACALERDQASRAQGLHPAYGAQWDQVARYTLVGVRGERAVYAHYARPWRPRLNTFTQPDLDGVEIRTRTRHHWDLIARPRDQARRYILVTCDW